MLRKRSGAIEWLEFEILQDIPNLVHGVFLRHGGYSTGEFSSLNTGLMAGDDPSAVRKNIEAIRSAIGVPYLSNALQCHGIGVGYVAETMSETFSGCDALMTQQKGVGLLIKHADCQAAILVDPINRAIANVHSGWRGNVQNIYKETVVRMQSQFGSKAEDLLVAISPSLGPNASQFINYRTELPETFWQFQFKPDYFNLWETSRWQLSECGILPHHIEIASICTYENESDFFSYRRVKMSGRHATVVALV